MASWWAASFRAAIVWIFFQKVVHIAAAFAGLFGEIPAYRLAAVIPLLFGGDLWSAGIVAAVATLVACLPILLALRGVAVVLSTIVSSVFAGLGVVSFFTMLSTGNALDRTLIGMVRIQIAGEAGFSNLSDSVGRYLSGWPLAYLALSMILAAWVSLHVLVKPAPPRSRTRRAVLSSVVGLFAATHLLILPGLKSRELIGEQLRTYGVDRSFPFDLVASYLRAAASSLNAPAAALRDPFRLDLKSIAVPENPTAPILNPVHPMRTNLILVLLESVGAVYPEADASIWPFWTRIADSEPNAVSFERHYTTWPQTTNALFSILCSELPYPSDEPISVVNPTIPCESLPEVLKRHGYRVALFSSQDITFDMTHQYLRGRGFDPMVDVRTLAATCWKTSWGADDRCTVAEGLEWMASDTSRPSFLLLQFVTGHHPYDVPPDVGSESPDAPELTRYLRSLEFLDGVLSSLFQKVEARGLASSTLIVVLSDHGESFGQHPGDFGHGATIWESATRVPFGVRGPQLHDLPARRVREPTSHLDVAPTVLGLLGVPIPFTMKGRDLTRIAEHRILLMGGRPQASQFGLRDGPFKFVWTFETGVRELFRVEEDPHERRDVSAEYPDLTRQYREIIETWRFHSRHLIENYAEILARTPR